MKKRCCNHNTLKDLEKCGSVTFSLVLMPAKSCLFSQIFTAAAADERKNIVLLAFETVEKIVREYFPYITETETTTFTDCVRCLLTFTNSKFNSDVCLNAIAFLRFCAVKLAEGGLVCYEKKDVDDSSSQAENEDKDEHASFWFPLLTGKLL